MKNEEKNIFVRLITRYAVSPEKLIALAIIAAVAAGLLYFFLSSRQKITDPETRKISALFSDDQTASQYTFLSGAVTGMTNRVKAAVRLGYFMNYTAYFSMSHNDAAALTDILSDNLVRMGFTFDGEARILLQTKKAGMINDYMAQQAQFEAHITNALGTSMYFYRVGDALWHLNYAVQSRQQFPAAYEALLKDVDHGIAGITAIYQEYLEGKRVRAEVRTLIRCYIAD